MELSSDSHPATGRDYGSPHIVGFYFFTTNHTNLTGSTRWGSPFRPPLWAQSLILAVHGLGLIPQDIPTGQIFAYSLRTGTRSKCLPNPWGVTLMTEPNHRRCLHDAVGFSFFTTTSRWIPKGITSRIRTQSLRTGVHDAVGFPFFTTTNGWIPTDITSRICTQSLRTGVHDAVGFPFFTTTNKQIPTGAWHTRVWFFPTIT